jgi:hypothetical protein
MAGPGGEGCGAHRLRLTTMRWSLLPPTPERNGLRPHAERGAVGAAARLVPPQLADLADGLTQAGRLVTVRARLPVVAAGDALRVSHGRGRFLYSAVFR